MELRIVLELYFQLEKGMLMGVNIGRVDKNLNWIENYGYIDEKLINIILEQSKASKFKCLKYLDYCDHTYFNNEQWDQLRKEIDILKNNTHLSDEILKGFYKCLEEVKYFPDQYYGFIGDQVLLSVIDEFNEYENKFGMFKLEDLSKLIKKSKDLDFACLAFISLKVDTIFNQLQMKDIQKELDILRSKTNVSRDILDKIETAIQLGLSNDYRYLKFEPI